MNHATDDNDTPEPAVDTPEAAVDARPDLETLPLAPDPADETPPLGTEQAPWGGPELVESTYGPLTEHYERLQSGLGDDAPGWSARIAALHALRAGHAAGDWETLARLLVAPATLPEDTGTVRLVRTTDEAETVHALVKDLKSAGHRTLLLAPTPAKAAELLGAVQDDPELLTLLIETLPATPPQPPPSAPAPAPDHTPDPSDETRALPPVPDEAPPQPSASAGTLAAPPVPDDALPQTAASASAETLAVPPVPDAPSSASAETLAVPPVPDDALPQTAASTETEARPPVSEPAPRDFGSHGTVEFKPVTGLPAPGSGSGATAAPSSPEPTRAEPLPAQPADADADAGGPATTAPDAPGPPPEAGAAEVTRAEALRALPADEPSAKASPPPSGSPAPAHEASAAEAAPAEVSPDGPTDAGGAQDGSDAAQDVPDAPASPPSGEDTETADEVVPEVWVRDVAVRTVGDGWARAWRTEAGLLRRGLMWMEQWPRDAEALATVRQEARTHREALDAELDGIARAIEEAVEAARGAAERAGAADGEAERLVAVREEAVAEVAEPRAEADRLQAVADAAGVEASGLTQVADEAFARCAQLDERTGNAQRELQGAQQVEASLADELERAREALPAAAEAADRLAAADADASAEGHASYYRLVSAESALAAVRRKMTLTQRLHVAAPPSDLRSVRAEVRARAREADEAAQRAAEAKDAAERAEAQRQGLASFVADGGSRLATAREAQERLTTELAWLATERESAGAEHREQARRAAEAVDRATEAGLEARVAQQAARAVEERVEAAEAAREEALAVAGRARADAEAATAREAELREALERRTGEGAREAEAHAAEVESAAEVEAGSRENVRELCGADPADDPEAMARYQRPAMARIEELGGYLQGDPDGAPLVPVADVVAGTPLGVGMAAPEQFDALVAVGVTDGEFLVGAVRAARWFLVGTPEDGGEPGRGTFARCAVAAPRLVEG